MSDIHTFVTGISSPLLPLKMNEFLSCTCTVCCRRVIPSISNTFRAVLVRGYTRHSPRISCAQSIVSAPLTVSAARHSSNVSTWNRHQRANLAATGKTGSTTILIIVHSSTCRCSSYVTEESNDEKKIHKKSSKPSSSSEPSNCLHQPSARM